MFLGNVECTFCETGTFVKAGMIFNWGEKKPFFLKKKKPHNLKQHSAKRSFYLPPPRPRVL